MNREIAEKAAQRRKDEMTSSEILLFVKEEVAKYDDGKPSSLVIQAIREACLNLVSPKAAEAPGGQDELGTCNSEPKLAHTKANHGVGCIGWQSVAALAAPSERSRFVEWYAKWPKGRPTSDGLTVPEIIEAAEAYAEYALAGLSSQEGK